MSETILKVIKGQTFVNGITNCFDKRQELQKLVMSLEWIRIHLFGREIVVDNVMSQAWLNFNWIRVKFVFLNIHDYEI